jgi:predicted enzyme related to lactoylglutathione lyase
MRSLSMQPGQSGQVKASCCLINALNTSVSKRRKTMANNPAVWFEIYVQDMERAKKFYESVLQVEFEKLNSPEVEMLAFPMDMNSPGASGALVKMEGFPSGGNSTLIYFSCTDCAVEAGRVTSSGGRLQREKMSIGQYGFIALAVDTEGNMFGLHSLQ